MGETQSNLSPEEEKIRERAKEIPLESFLSEKAVIFLRTEIFEGVDKVLTLNDLLDQDPDVIGMTEFLSTGEIKEQEGKETEASTPLTDEIITAVSLKLSELGI